MLEYAVDSNIGNNRDNNEDHFLARAELGLWIVADGVGGHETGEVASEMACDIIGAAVEQGIEVDEAIQRAHQAILQASADGIGRPGMAATVVVLRVIGQTYNIWWVGDSRAYRLPFQSGDGLQQLSVDQSLVQRLLDDGVINEDEAQAHPRRNVVLQALGQEGNEKLDVGFAQGLFKSNDRIVLCSDGLSDYVSAENIERCVRLSNPLSDTVNTLIDQALANHAKDNVTVLVVQQTETTECAEKDIKTGQSQGFIARLWRRFTN